MPDVDRALTAIGSGLGYVAGSEDDDLAMVASDLLICLDDDRRSASFRDAVVSLLDGPR